VLSGFCIAPLANGYQKLHQIEFCLVVCYRQTYVFKYPKVWCILFRNPSIEFWWEV